MRERPNIVLIAADTLRADHLSSYGYIHPTSPRLDALAAEGVLAERLFCPGIPTHPSFTTLYTGQHPVRHGIVSHGGKAQLAREAPMLPELLMQEGYTTCAVDNLWRARSWFGRGYEFYIDPSVKRGLLLSVTCEEINDRAIPWLRQNQERPFFLFLHYWDPHYPLAPPPRYQHMFYDGKDPYDPENRSLEEWWEDPLGGLAKDTWLRHPEGLITDVNYVSALYDQEIRYLDDAITDVLSAIDELGLTEDTLVVFLADHGTSLTKHGIFFEHHGLYDDTIHVPLILRWPGRLQPGSRFHQMLHMSDVGPTILDALGFPVPEEADGVSAWPLLSGQTNEGGHDRVVSAECTWQAKWSLRNDHHKLIVSRDSGLHGGPGIELYDLEHDPSEEHNVAEEDAETTREMEDALEGWIAKKLQELGKDEDPLVEQGISLKHLTA